MVDSGISTALLSPLIMHHKASKALFVSKEMHYKFTLPQDS